MFLLIRVNLQERLKHLDGLRGLAIISVFGYHLFVVNSKSDFFSNIFRYGDLGVHLFFLISGFVIFMSLEKSKNFLTFIKKRYFRLFPSMLFASVLYCIMFYPFDALNLLPGLTFVDPRIINLIAEINTKEISAVFWTLFIEFKFYYIVGIAYFALKEKTGIFIGFLYLFYLASKFLNLYFPNQIFVYLYDLGKLMGFAWFSWFATGIFIYKQISTKKIFYFYLICLFSFLSSLHLSVQYGSVPLFICCVLINFLFYLSFYSKKIISFFTNNFFLAFGLASYPLYLMHHFLLFPIQSKFEKIFGVELYAIYSLITFFGISFFSLLIAKHYEPIFKKKMNLKKL